MSTMHVVHPRPIRRIAVFRALYLGDLLLSVPALRSLRAGFPQAEITLIGLPWTRWFVERFDRYVDRHVEFKGFPGLLEVDYDPIASERALRALRRDDYDLVVQLHGDGTTSNRFIRTIVCPGKQSAGLYSGARPDFLTYAAPYPSEQPEVTRGLGLMRELGCPDTGLELELPLLPSDHDEAERLLGKLTLERPLIGIHAGARSPARRWTPDRFARVADTLASETGARILLTGSGDEADLACAVAARMSQPAVNLAGRTSLGGLAGLISRLDLFISNDTGPAHIAHTLDIPSVTIFGPAEFHRWAPLDLQRHPVVRRPVACSPCPHWECPIDHRCLGWIEPEEVLETARQQLTKGSVAS